MTALLSPEQRAALESALAMPRVTVTDDRRFLDAVRHAFPWHGSPNLTGQARWLLDADARIRAVQPVVNNPCEHTYGKYNSSIDPTWRCASCGTVLPQSCPMTATPCGTGCRCFSGAQP